MMRWNNIHKMTFIVGGCCIITGMVVYFHRPQNNAAANIVLAGKISGPHKNNTQASVNELITSTISVFDQDKLPFEFLSPDPAQPFPMADIMQEFNDDPGLSRTGWWVDKTYGQAIRFIADRNNGKFYFQMITKSSGKIIQAHLVDIGNNIDILPAVIEHLSAARTAPDDQRVQKAIYMINVSGQSEEAIIPGHPQYVEERYYPGKRHSFRTLRHIDSQVSVNVEGFLFPENRIDVTWSSNDGAAVGPLGFSRVEYRDGKFFAENSDGNEGPTPYIAKDPKTDAVYNATADHLRILSKYQR